MSINNIVVRVLGEVVKSFNVDAKIVLSTLTNKNTESIPLLIKLTIMYGHPNSGFAYLIFQWIKTDLIQFLVLFQFLI